MTKARVMYYLNQFFAGMGGEEQADTPVGSREGVIGPGRRLQALLGDSAEIVVTAYCGDNYFAEHRDEALTSILQIAREQNAEMVIAGPAFQAGRYGFACTEVCHFLSTSLDLYCVTGMNIENAGVVAYKQYKDRKVFLLPTEREILGMEDALSNIARFISKLAAGSIIGTAAEEGYMPRGIRLVEVASRSGVERAVDMLLDKLAGRSFTTEIPIESLERIPPPHRITNLRDACLALATSSGVVPPGNPDGFKPYLNTQWRKYPIDKLNSMLDTKWDVVHGGYHPVSMMNNPNYGVPLDACRELEREGVLGRLYPYYYATSGCTALLSAMEAIGREMVRDMKAEGVDAVLWVST